jgi:hypothetical protein
MPNLSIISFSSGFRVFKKLLSQFGLDMFDLWPRHIRLTGHVRPLARTYPALEFPGYIRGPLPLRTLNSLITFSTQTLAVLRLSQSDFGSLPPNPFGS